jgi:acyl carrier protein
MFEQIKALMVRKFQLDATEVAPESTFADLGLDSLDLVELSMALETELEARITDVELAEAQGLDAVARLISIRGARV